ncbi:MucBP domain-containing protein, partial [Enterococcus faecalis]|nr:MucBP domain-containing protein [Enterococcus faecalis]
ITYLNDKEVSELEQKEERAIGDISFRNFRAEKFSGESNLTDANFRIRGNLVYYGIRKIDSISFETTSGCELSINSEGVGAYIGSYYTPDFLVQSHFANFNFGGNYPASEFLGSLHARITSDYYVTIRVTSEGKTYSDTYYNFFGNPALQGDISFENFRAEKYSGEPNPVDANFLIRGNLVYNGIRKIDSISFETTPGCDLGLNTTGEPIGAYLGVNFTNDVLVINSKVIINFGGGYSASEFLGSLHAKITSDYYVTIRVTSEGKTYSNTYFNFFGNPNKQGTIQVKYVDEEGREIFPTETMTGNVGDSYETQAKEITGYILKERPNNASGTYKEENQTVTYIYKYLIIT